MVSEMGSSSVSGISAAMSAQATKSFVQATENEKKEMQSLNDRLGNYIDRVKGLESNNRKLVADLEELRGKWGQNTSDIKKKYAGELSESRKKIDDGAREKADIDVKVSRLQDDIAEYRRLFDEADSARESDDDKVKMYTSMIGDAHSEARLINQRMKSLNDEAARLTKDNKRAWDELQNVRKELDQESLGRIDFQNQTQTLMEELEFLRRIHDQEVKELQALLLNQPTDTREFFKNELALAIRDIRGEYDMIAQQNRADMESWYKLKVSEVQSATNRSMMDTNTQRDEVKRMRDNIGDARAKFADLEAKNAMLEKQVQQLTYHLEDDQRQYESALNDRDDQLRRMREECQALVAELQALLDTKQMLDTEIAIYRKMLEGEESRAGLRQMVEQAVKSQQQDSGSHGAGELSTRTTFQRSAKGNLSIAECEPFGKFIVIENTHGTKDENVSEWKLHRKLDGKKEVKFNFPAGTVVKAGKTCKVYAKDGGGKHAPPAEIVFDKEHSWGAGENVVTTLFNKEGDERATHTQRVVKSGV